MSFRNLAVCSVQCTRRKKNDVTNKNNKILCSPLDKALSSFLPEHLVQAFFQEVDIIHMEIVNLMQFGELRKDLCNNTGFL